MRIPFEGAEAQSLSAARKEFLDRFLLELIRTERIQTALDVGCGYGFFSHYLRSLGLRVMAFDARAENVGVARERVPDVAFSVGDIEDAAVLSLGAFDLVLCFGLLYHLENPLRAIRHLRALTRKILLIETVRVPFATEVAVLCEEPAERDQSVNYLALIMSDSFLTKSLYRAGFSVVYRTKSLPDHEDFRSSLLRERRRTIVVASHVTLALAELEPVAEPRARNPYLWYAAPVRWLLGHERLQQIVRTGRRWMSASREQQ